MAARLEKTTGKMTYLFLLSMTALLLLYAPIPRFGACHEIY